MALITNLTGPSSITAFTLQPIDDYIPYRPQYPQINPHSTQNYGLIKLYEARGGKFVERINGTTLTTRGFNGTDISHKMTSNGECISRLTTTDTGPTNSLLNATYTMSTSGTTISIWTNIASGNFTGNKHVFGDTSFGVYINNQEEWSIYNELNFPLDTNTKVPFDKLTHIGIVLEHGTNSYGSGAVYINGTLLSNNLVYDRAFLTPLTINYSNASAGLGLINDLFEYRIYNRALSSREINTLADYRTRWDLYSQPKTWFMPSSSTNSPFTLFIEGTAASLSGSVTLHTSGDATALNNNCTLYTAGDTGYATITDLFTWGHTSGDFRTFGIVPLRLRRTNWGRRPVPENILDDNRNFLGVWDFGGASYDKVFDRSRRQNHLTTGTNDTISWTTNIYSYGSNTATSEKLQKKVRKTSSTTKLKGRDDFKITTNKPFSISAWVFFDSYSRSSIFGNYVDSSNNGFFLNQQVDGTLQCLFMQSSTKYFTVNFPAVPLKQWVNITLQYDGNQSSTGFHNGLNIYYNGELQTASSRSVNGSTDSNLYGGPFYVGRTVFSVFDTYNAFTGMISSCFISDKVMSHTEIRKLAYDYYFNSPFIQTYTAGLIYPDGGGQNKLSLYISGTQLYSTNNVTLFLKNEITAFDGTRTLTTIYRQRRQNWQEKSPPTSIKSQKKGAVGLWRSEDGDKSRLEDYTNKNNHLTPRNIDDFEYTWATDAGSPYLANGKTIEKPVITMGGDSSMHVVNSGVYDYSIDDKFTINLWGKYNLEDFKCFYGTINNFITLEGYALITFPSTLLFLMGNTDVNYAYVEFPRPPTNQYNLITVRYGGAREVDTYGPVSGAIYGVDLFYNGIQQTPTTRVFNGTFDDWKRGDGPFYIGKGNNIGLDSVRGQFSSLSIFDRDLSNKEIVDLYHDFYLNTYFQQSVNIPLSYTQPVNVPLFVKAPEPSNDNLPLFVQVPEPSNSGLFLAISGDNSVINNLPLFIKNDVNNNLTLFLEADLGSGSAVMPLFIKGPIPNSLYSSTTLQIGGFGTLSSSGNSYVNFGPTLYISGTYVNPTAGMIMFLPGATTDTTTAAMNMYVGGRAYSLANSVNLAVYNLQEADYVPLYVRGLSLSSSPDSVPSAGTEIGQGMNLFISRNTPAAVSLFLCNNLVSSGDVTFYTFGAFMENDSVNLSIPSVEAVNTSSVKLYAHGF